MKQRLVFLSLLLFLLPIACGKDNGTGPANHAPTIQGWSDTLTTVEAGGAITITVEAEDPDRDVLDYSWEVEAGSITGSGKSVTWTAPATPGAYQVTVTVSDSRGGQVSRNIEITVVEANHPPTIKVPSVTPPSPVEKETSCTLSVEANDEDGDPLTYYWTANGEDIGSGASITWIAPDIGAYQINVTVSDGQVEVSRGIVVEVIEAAEPTPQITIIKPAAGSVVQGIVQIKVDVSSQVPINKVGFYIDDKLEGEDNSSPYSYYWGTTLYSNGRHTIKIIAYYDSGAQSTEVSYEVEVLNPIEVSHFSTLHLAPGAYPGFTAKYYLLFEVSLNNVDPQLIDSVTVTAPDGKIHELKDVEPNGICLIENNAPSDSLYRLASPLSAPPPLGRYTFTVTFTGSSSIQEATKELTEAPLPIPEIIQPENNQETSSTPTLTWEGLSGAAVYEVKITSPESDPCPPIPIWKKDLIETTTIDVSQPLPIGETYLWYLFSASNREFKNLSLTAGLFKVVSEGEIPKVTGTITVVGEPTGKVSVGCFKRGTFEMVATGSVDSSESYQIELPTTVSGYTSLNVLAWDDTNGDGIWSGDEKISVPGNDYLEYQGGQWYVAHWGDQREPLSPQTPINILLSLGDPPPPPPGGAVRRIRVLE
ncbi:MAG: Ig-like domain-containing protein [bacterium]|nr:Ig-like domain-containing protein [bacterium]